MADLSKLTRSLFGGLQSLKAPSGPLGPGRSSIYLVGKYPPYYV